MIVCNVRRCTCMFVSLRAINHTFSQQVLAYMTVHVFVYDCAGLYRYLWKNFGHQINTSILNTQYHRRLSQRPILATTAWSRVFTKMGTSAQHENVNESFSSKYFLLSLEIAQFQSSRLHVKSSLSHYCCKSHPKSDTSKPHRLHTS